MKYIRKETRVLEGLRRAETPKENEISKIERELAELNEILKLVKI